MIALVLRAPRARLPAAAARPPALTAPRAPKASGRLEQPPTSTRSRRSTTSRSRATSSSTTCASAPRIVAATGPPGSVLDVGLRHGRAGASGWRCAATRSRASIRPTGCSRSCARRSPAVRAVQGSGTELPFEDDELRPRADAWRSCTTSPTRATSAQTLAEMVRVSRPWGRVLIWDHNPRNPYWGNLMARVPQDTGEERLVGRGRDRQGPDRRRRAGPPIQQLGLVPDFTPRRALASPPRSSGWLERTPGDAAAGRAQRDPGHQAAAASSCRASESSATISPSGSRRSAAARSGGRSPAAAIRAPGRRRRAGAPAGSRPGCARSPASTVRAAAVDEQPLARAQAGDLGGRASPSTARGRGCRRPGRR